MCVGWVTPVDVIAKRLLLTASQVYFLSLKAWVGPIFLKRHRPGYSHSVDDVLVALPRFGPGPDHPVADGRTFSDFRFARCQSTDAVEWIRRKAEVSGNNIRV